MARAHSSKANPVAATPAEAALREFVRTGGLLKRVTDPYFARFGISPAQWGILRALQRCEEAGGDPPRLTDLCPLLLVHPPSVSGVVDRLERMRLVTRFKPGDDRRTRRIGLTDGGRTLVKTVLAGHAAWIGLIMAGMSAGEQRALARLLRKLGAHLGPLAERADGGRAPAEAPKARSGGRGKARRER